MIVTTVRFDHDLGYQAEQLGIAKAVLVRDATILRLARIEINDTILPKLAEEMLRQHGTRLDKIERWIVRGGR